MKIFFFSFLHCPTTKQENPIFHNQKNCEKKNIKTIPKSGSRHNRNFEQNKSRTRTKGEKSRVKERNSLQRGLDLRNVNREREGEVVVVVVVLDYVSWVFIVSSNGPKERRNLARFCVFRML